jgi:hypothetical protein
VLRDERIELRRGGAPELGDLPTAFEELERRHGRDTETLRELLIPVHVDFLRESKRARQRERNVALPLPRRRRCQCHCRSVSGQQSRAL